MKKLVFYLLIPAVWILMAVSLRKTGTQDHSGALVKKDTLQYPEERHFRNMQQLTFGGTNAEAYFSYDGKWLIFQRTNIKEGIPCDQMFIGKLPKNPGEAFTYKMISNGKGRTTCGFFTPDGKHIIYASTFLSGDSCPPVPDREKMKRYIWPVYAGYDIFMADLDGKIVKQLTTS